MAKGLGSGLKPISRRLFRNSTLEIAPQLLGVNLCRKLNDGTILTGRIVEAEAYTQDDPACHAFRGITPRSKIMYGPPGFAYVYFIYGMYHCLNVVTEAQGIAGAVLIRALEFDGANGPGKLCRQWQIDKSMNGLDLLDSESPLWLSRGSLKSDETIEITPRIGISVATDRLWRFSIRGNKFVSK
jgi:DNA-3-methyladenine glycosylase